MYELASGKTALLHHRGYGASLGCSSMHLSYAKAMVAEGRQAGWPGPAGVHVHLGLNTAADTHIAVSRNHDARVVGVLLSHFTFSATL